MTGSTGRFIWHELHTDDVPRSVAFYLDVIGWTAGKTTDGNTPTTLFSTKIDDRTVPVAAVIDAKDAVDSAAALTGWIGYIGVEDFDDTLAGLLRSGAELRRAPSYMNGIGRHAVLADPQRASFGILEPSQSDTGLHEPSVEPGQMTWRELYATDPVAAFEFYAAAFGWRKAHSFDMGPAGPYQIFSIDGVPSGGIMRAPSSMPDPAWNHFVQMQGIEAAAARITAGGGHVFDGIREASPGVLTVKGYDPRRSLFALSGRRR